MKTVFSNQSDIAHLWIEQSQYHAKTPNNTIYFRDNTIYSYGGHFPIASIHQRDNKELVILFTTRTRSNTTAGHIATCEAASSHYRKIYCKDPLEAHNNQHQENVESFERRAKTLSESLPKSKKPEIYLSQIGHIRDQLNDYATYFDLDLKRFPLAYVWIETKSGQGEASEKERLEIARIEENRKIERAKLVKKSLTAFRTFKCDTVYSSEYSFLRFNAESKRIETSQRIELPLVAAKSFYHCVKSIAIGKTEFKPDNCKILSYTLLECNKEYARIGCHKITIKEIDRTAKLLNWEIVK